MKRFRLLLVFGVLLALVDCSPKRTAERRNNVDQLNLAPRTPTFTNLYNSVFSQACAQCHNPGTAPAGTSVDFSSITAAYQTLLSGTASGLSTAGHCSQVKLVNPGDPSTSYLAAVLIQSFDHDDFVEPGCSPYATHLQDQNLSADEQAALVGWIQSGAANN